METQARVLTAQRFAELFGDLPQLEADTHKLCKESTARDRDLCELQLELDAVRQRAGQLEGRLFEFRDSFKWFEEDDPLWKAFSDLHERFSNVNRDLGTAYNATRAPRATR